MDVLLTLVNRSGNCPKLKSSGIPPGLVLIVLIVLLTTAAQGFALEAGAKVQLLQAPAWLERDGQRHALRRGMDLAGGDRILTGADSRVLLRLEEGSWVKLGADANLLLEQLHPPSASGGVFEGALNVLKGAFRFTTQLADRKRNITTHLGSATIGIRGTDVWGKAEEERDFVVLLEGEVTIERAGVETIVNEPLALFMAPRDQPSLPVAPVNPDDLGRWAAETEPQAGQGMVSDSGEYRLNLASFSSAAGAENLVAKLDSQGFAFAVTAVELAGKRWWRVVGADYASRDDAQFALDSIVSSHALQSPWIEHRQ